MWCLPVSGSHVYKNSDVKAVKDTLLDGGCGVNPNYAAKASKRLSRTPFRRFSMPLPMFVARNWVETVQLNANASFKPVRTPFSVYFRHTKSCRHYASCPSDYARSMLPTKYNPIMVTQRKSRCNMHMPITSVIDDSCTHLHQPHDNPLD